MKKYFYFLIPCACVFVFFSESNAQWSAKAQFPGDAFGASGFQINNKYYVAGGVVKNQLFIYNSDSNIWTATKGLPGDSGRIFGTTFSVNGKGYYCGGFYGTALDTLTSDILEYDPTKNSWTKIDTFPGGARTDMFAFTINGKAYVGGGEDLDYIYTDFYEFDPLTKKWAKLTTYPGGGGGFNVGFAIGNKGYSGMGEGSSSNFNDFYEYNPTTDTWKKLADFPGVGRVGAVGFEADAKGIVGLGMDNDIIPQDDIYEYSVVDDTWKMLAPLPSARALSLGFSAKSNLYICAGADLKSGITYQTLLSISHQSASLNEIKGKEDLILFLNPSNEILNLNRKSISHQSINLINLEGRMIYKDELRPGETKKELDISTLCSGIYLLKVGDNFYRFMKE